MDFGMSGDDLEQMYQEVILEASRNPHGRERFAPDLASEQSAQAGESVVRASHEYCAAGESHQFNPTCGDEATIHAEVSDGGDGRPHTIERLVWDGHGCSISFHKLMDSRGAGLSDESAEEDLGDAVVFQGVSKYPMRIKCALLGWEGMKASVAEALARMQ